MSSNLQALIPHIYHERQQPGSMLCAQHALNSLLQGNYFTAPDLSDLARSLDELEESYDDDHMGRTSTNMDDTGFFSVQVLDNALKVWGLNLVRWQSEDMRPYHDRPHAQLAFILNLEQHWFTLRRFGAVNADENENGGNSHWFNLNSFLSSPEWVSKVYLGMVLQQAEGEGYSVFTVVQDPEMTRALPRTEADVIALTLPEPNAGSVPSSEARQSQPELSRHINPEHEGFEDEDYELQAALQASLTQKSEASSSVNTSSVTQPDPHAPFIARSGSHTPGPPSPRLPTIPLPGHADVDLVTASMERNRILLQRMREQQEYAQREMWSESDLTPEEQLALNERRERMRKEEEEEAEELRRAIEESEAMAKRHFQNFESHCANVNEAPSGAGVHYDDEDSELQAALRASLETGSYSESSSTNADDEESISSGAASSDVTTETEEAPAPSLEEIRRARLARFGLP